MYHERWRNYDDNLASCNRQMFGKGKATRIYRGKKYKVANWHLTKKAADMSAVSFRKLGHSAQVTRVYNRQLKRWGYMVYVR